jgi:hypothetical protein
MGDMKAPVAPDDWRIGCCCAGGGGGGADPASGLPNMLVNSPGGFPVAAGGAAEGVAAGKPDAAGNCGDASTPGPWGLKYRVNSPPLGASSGVVGAPCLGIPDWNIWVKAPGSCLGAACGGQSPSGFVAGRGELNMRVNSPPCEDPDDGDEGGGCGAD